MGGGTMARTPVVEEKKVLYHTSAQFQDLLKNLCLLWYNPNIPILGNKVVMVFGLRSSRVLVRGHTLF